MAHIVQRPCRRFKLGLYSLMQTVLRSESVTGWVKRFASVLVVSALIVAPAICLAQSSIDEVHDNRRKELMALPVVTGGYPVFVRDMFNSKTVPIAKMSVAPSIFFHKSVSSALEQLYLGSIIPKDTIVVIDDYPPMLRESGPKFAWPEQAVIPDAVSPWVWVKAPEKRGEPAEVHVLRTQLRLTADALALKEGKPFNQMYSPSTTFECYMTSIGTFMRLYAADRPPFDLWVKPQDCLDKPLREPFYYMLSISGPPGIAQFQVNIGNAIDRCFEEMETFYSRLFVDLIPAAINESLDPDGASDDWWVKPTEDVRKSFEGNMPSCEK